MKSSGWSVGLWCLLSLTRADGNQSTEAIKRLTLEELTQLEITSLGKEAEPAFRSATSISVLTQEDIRRSGATNLPDLLRLVPGVQVSQIDSVQWAVGIRGFQGRLSRSVLVLIDGRSLYTPLFAGVYWEMQDTLIEDIDRIEVIRGPGGTIWGANAVNGVINIITKSSRETRGMLVSAGGGTLEQGFLNWRYGGGTDKLSYRVYGKGFSRGPQYHPDSRNFDDWRMGQTGFRVDWAASKRDTVTLHGDAYGTVAGMKLNISRFTPPSITAVEDNGYFNGQNLVGKWLRRYESGSELQVQAYYDRTDRQDLNYREVRHTFDVDMVHHIPIRRHRLGWGLWARSSPSQYFQTTETVDFRPHEQTYNIFSAFFEDEITIVPDKLSITAGARVQHNTFSGVEVQPTARFSWTPSGRSTIWGAFTRAVRTPSRIEEGFSFSALAAPAAPLYIRLVGDGEFRSEELRGYELGYRRKWSKGVLSVSGFHNRYDDLLSVDSRAVFVENTPLPPHAVLPLYLRNGVVGTTTGGEAVALWDLRKWWRVRGSYSLALLDARNKPESNDASTVRQLEGDSAERKFLAMSRFDLPGRLDLDLYLRRASEIPLQLVPGYTTGDVRLAWRPHPQWEVSLTGRNLFRPWQVEYRDNPGPLAGIRRSVFVKLVWGM